MMFLGEAADFKDLIVSEIYWYGREVGRLAGGLLNFAMPVFLGIFASEAYKSITSSTNIWQWGLWFSHWPVLATAGLWLIGYLLTRYNNHLLGKSEELYSSIRWICEDLGTRNNLSQDIRCTLWIPVNTKSRNSPIRLLQITPYYPKQSTIFGSTSQIRKNGRHLRTFKVSRRTAGEIRPIGILGLTAMESVGGDEPRINIEYFDSRTDFVEYMVANWHFSKLHARRLTTNRKAYLCFPIVNREKTQLLGILYFDSCRTRTFDDKFVRTAEKYLPRLASKMIDL